MGIDFNHVEKPKALADIWIEFLRLACDRGGFVVS